MPVRVGHNIPHEVIPHMPRVLVHAAPQAAVHLQALLKPAHVQHVLTLDRRSQGARPVG